MVWRSTATTINTSRTAYRYKYKHMKGTVRNIHHYENMPIQIYRKFYHQKNENFQLSNYDIFLISAQNIDSGHSLEPASTRRF